MTKGSVSLKVKEYIKNRRSSWIAPLLFLVTFCVYLFTLCPTFYWRDSAEFIDAAYALGVAHPAGFPTYLPLANFLTYLPFGPIAFKINMLSALMGAAASVAVFYLTKRLISTLGGDGEERRALYFSSATALTFAFSFSLWESSVSAEVYAGMGLVSALILLWAIKWIETADSRFLFAGSFLLGLAAGLHGTAAFFVPALVIFVILNYRGRLRPSDLVMILFFFFIGFSVYIYLPLRSAAGPRIDWGNPRTLEGFLIQILDKKDTAYHFAISRGGMFQKIGEFFYILVRELTLLWPIAALFGFYLVFRKNWKLFVLLILFGALHIAFFIWYWSAGTIYTPFYVVVMAVGGAGLFSFSRWLSGMPNLRVNGARILAVITAAFVCFSLVYNYGSLDKSDYYAAEDFTLSDYHRFDYGSMIITNLLWPNFYCLQEIDRLREDLIIIAVGDVIQPKYFHRFSRERYPGLNIPEGPVEKNTGVTFLKNMIFLNYHYRTVYVGSDEDIIKKLSYRLLPEVLFFRLVSEEEAKSASTEYYDEYIKRLDTFTKRQIGTLGPDYYTDEIFVDYYRIIFNTLSFFFIDRKLWDVELEVLRYSAVFGSLTTKQMIDTGVALMNRGELAEAETALTRALDVEPSNCRGHIELGHVYILMKKYENAEREFKTALKCGAEEFQAYYGLGLCAYHEGRYTEAEENFRRAMEHATTRTKEEDKDIVRKLLARIAEENAE